MSILIICVIRLILGRTHQHMCVPILALLGLFFPNATRIGSQQFILLTK